MNKYTCPCCGYKTLEYSPGNYDGCPICFWEDDVTQVEHPLELGSNKVNLVTAQVNFETFGACEEKFVPLVRKPTKDDVKDSTWKKVSSSV